MESVPKVAVEAYKERMREVTEAMLHGVMGAVNKARDGAWINDSEMEVRDLLAEYRRTAYEIAVQMKMDAAQAAFSPGGRPDGAAVA